MGRRSHPAYTRKTSDPDLVEAQKALGSRPAKPFPKRKEKRLINGKWTRDYDLNPGVVVNQAAKMMAETPPPLPPALTPAQQRMRELAAKLKEKKDAAAV